jgi:glycosyltransferase involved in cell wall biosynthesis
MTDIPAVSVVIPLYNKGPYIARALNSVLAQTFQDFEVIVVDDGSTDDGAEVVRGFDDPRIRLIQQENQGVSAARNRGIEAARAELVAFLDADDEWLPGFLRTIEKLIQRYPNSGAYVTSYCKCTTLGEVVPPKLREIPNAENDCMLPSYFRSVALGSFPVNSSNVVIPKHVFDSVGRFPKGVWWSEDSDQWGRIALKYSIAFSWDVQVLIHCGNSRECKYRQVEVHPFVKTAIERINNNQVPKQILDDLVEYIAKENINTAVLTLENGDRKEARRLLFQCKTKLLFKRKMLYIALSFLPHGIYKILRYGIYPHVRKKGIVDWGE